MERTILLGNATLRWIPMAILWGLWQVANLAISPKERFKNPSLGGELEKPNSSKAPKRGLPRFGS